MSHCFKKKDFISGVQNMFSQSETPDYFSCRGICSGETCVDSDSIYYSKIFIYTVQSFELRNKFADQLGSASLYLYRFFF